MPIVVDLCWGVGGGGEREERVYSNTRVNNNCSVSKNFSGKYKNKTKNNVLDLKKKVNVVYL